MVVPIMDDPMEAIIATTLDDSSKNLNTKTTQQEFIMALGVPPIASKDHKEIARAVTETTQQIDNHIDRNSSTKVLNQLAQQMHDGSQKLLSQEYLVKNKIVI